MISGLRGRITEKNLDSISIDVSGVVYKIYITKQVLEDLNISNKSSGEVFVYTYLSVRENALDLYGFIKPEDKGLFQLLLTISGVGPKSALNIMNSVTRDMIEEGISKEDPKYLAKISGLGNKTAEKIILGLKNKIGSISPNNSAKKADNSLAMDALVSLGYSEREVRESIKKIETKDKNHQEIIKEALKYLGS